MTRLAGTQTEKNLITAFAGESQARNRYDFASAKAKKDGFILISRLFEEIAEQERSHAKNFFKFLEGGELTSELPFPAGVIGTTEENLAAAVMGEHAEQSELYPEFARVAKEEGFLDIAAKFLSIAVAESHHEARFQHLLERLRTNTLFERDEETTWRCLKCGYISIGNKAPEKCPACDHGQAYFEALEEL